MTQLSSYLDWLRSKGGRVTLGEILGTHYAAEYRKLHTLLRHQGMAVNVELNRKVPGLNTYTLIERPTGPMVQTEFRGMFA